LAFVITEAIVVHDKIRILHKRKHSEYLYLNGYLEDIGDTIDMPIYGNTSILEYLNGRIGKQWKSPRNSLQISNSTLTVRDIW